MKTRMKKLFIYTVGICLLSAFTSCKDDREENKYRNQQNLPVCRNPGYYRVRKHSINSKCRFNIDL